MKKFFLFFLCFMLCTACIYADDELSDDSEPVQTDNASSAPVVVDITQLINSVQSDNKTTEPDTDEPLLVVVDEPQLINMTTEQQRISASDTSGFKAVLLSILGDYETTITDYEYRTGSSSYTSHSISIERDWAWICSCCVFGLLCWCTFRTIGGICARF